MEARAILLTSLVFALWTSSTTGQTTNFCTGKADGPYCEHCMQPVQCTLGTSTVYDPCGAGQACTIAVGVSFCAPHTETDCACTGAGDQCDAYNPAYLDHCFASGPFLVEKCPTTAPTCYKGECGAFKVCNQVGYNLTPECNSAYYCDANSVIYYGIDCASDEYVTSALECAPAPPPACDGSCTGKCPNPVDCTKYFVCDGATWLGSVTCPTGQSYDIDLRDCTASSTPHCTLLDGCDFLIVTGSPGSGSTTTTESTATATGTTTAPGTNTSTTTPLTTTTTIPAETCTSSTVGNRYPYASCSQCYYSCALLGTGVYGNVVALCPGDTFFDTNTTNPYCTAFANIETCSPPADIVTCLL